MAVMKIHIEVALVKVSCIYVEEMTREAGFDTANLGFRLYQVLINTLCHGCLLLMVKCKRDTIIAHHDAELGIHKISLTYHGLEAIDGLQFDWLHMG